MTTVNIHAAKTNLSKLIEAALSGEDIVIAKAGTPAVRLVPVAAGNIALTSGQRLARGFGSWEGRIDLPSLEDWRHGDAEIEADFMESVSKSDP